jgi:hypothetical protein
MSSSVQWSWTALQRDLTHRMAQGGNNSHNLVTIQTKRAKLLLTDLNGQHDSNTAQAFSRIAGKCFDGGIFAARGDDYLRRRNFTSTRWQAGHSSDEPTFNYVADPLVVGLRREYSHKVMASKPGEVGKLNGDAAPRIGGGPICAAVVDLRRSPEHSSMMGIEKFVDVPRRVGVVTPTGISLGAPLPRSVFG